MRSFNLLRSQLCCFPKPITPTASNPPFLIKTPYISSSPSPSVVVVPPIRTTTSLLPRQTRASGTKLLSHKHKPKPLVLILTSQDQEEEEEEEEELLPKSSETWKEEEFAHHVYSPNGYSISRFVIIGAVSVVGFVVFVMGVDDDHKALALGPEGPLMEEFWDNMRRYALYALTVSTGVAYTLFQPIFELLKNPISAILILTIFGGSIYIVSQVLTAMVGVSDFNYEYGY